MPPTCCAELSRGVSVNKGCHMSFPTKEERRHKPRTECNLPARIHRASRSFDGLIGNASDNGVFLCSSQKLPPGECVRIAVEPAGCAPLEIYAEVIWSRILRHDEPVGLYAIVCGFIYVCLKKDRSLTDLAIEVTVFTISTTSASQLIIQSTNQLNCMPYAQCLVAMI